MFFSLVFTQQGQIDERKLAAMNTGDKFIPDSYLLIELKPDAETSFPKSSNLPEAQASAPEIIMLSTNYYL